MSSEMLARLLTRGAAVAPLGADGTLGNDGLPGGSPGELTVEQQAQELGGVQVTVGVVTDFSEHVLLRLVEPQGDDLASHVQKCNTLCSRMQENSFRGLWQG